MKLAKFFFLFFFPIFICRAMEMNENFYASANDSELATIKNNIPEGYFIHVAGKCDEIEDSVFAVYKWTEESYKEWKKKVDEYDMNKINLPGECPIVSNMYKMKLNADNIGFTEVDVECSTYRDGGSIELESVYGTFYIPTADLLKKGKKPTLSGDNEKFSLRLFNNLE